MIVRRAPEIRGDKAACTEGRVQATRREEPTILQELQSGSNAERAGASRWPPNGNSRRTPGPPIPRYLERHEPFPQLRYDLPEVLANAARRPSAGAMQSQ